MAIVLSTKLKTVIVLILCVLGASFAIFIGNSSGWFSKSDPQVEPLVSMKREARLIASRIHEPISNFQVKCVKLSYNVKICEKPCCYNDGFNIGTLCIFFVCGYNPP